MKIINIKNKALKSAFLTVLFYVIYFLTSTIAEQFQKSGPCNPGLGMIVLLFLPIITVILLIFNLIKYYSQHKQYLKFSIFIHLLALLFFFSFYIYVSMENN